MYSTFSGAKTVSYPKLGGVGDLRIGDLDLDLRPLLLLLLGDRGDLDRRRRVGVGDLLGTNTFVVMC